MQYTASPGSAENILVRQRSNDYSQGIQVWVQNNQLSALSDTIFSKKLFSAPKIPSMCNSVLKTDPDVFNTLRTQCNILSIPNHF